MKRRDPGLTALTVVLLVSLNTAADGRVPPVSVTRLYDLAPWGVGVFEVPSGGPFTNVTQALISRAVKEARKFRQLAWCVNVVVLSDDPAFLASFAESSLRGRLLVWATRLLVITRLPANDLSGLFHDHWTFSMMNVMLVTTERTSRSIRCGVYVQFPYSPAGSQLVRLASWTPQRGLQLQTSLPLFPDKFSNFYGAPINVSAKSYKPYWFELKEEAADGSKKLSGMDYLLLETVAKALNFTIKVTPIASWAESLDNVVAKQSYITPVIHAVLRNRLERFDFTIPYTYASYSISMRTPGLAPKWQSLYYPLNGVVWVSIVATTALVVVVILMMNRLGDAISPGKSLDPGTTVIEVVGILIGENLYKTLPSENSRRVLLAAWLVFAFVLGSAYTGNLTAALTLPKYPPPPRDSPGTCAQRRQVAKSSSRVTMEPWGRDYKAFFKDSGSDVFTKLADLMELGPELLFGLDQATRKRIPILFIYPVYLLFLPLLSLLLPLLPNGSSPSRTAHMDSRAVLLLNIAESFTKADGTTPLYVVRESAIPGMSAWPVPHDAPFKKNLDRCIRASLEPAWRRLSRVRFSICSDVSFGEYRSEAFSWLTKARICVPEFWVSISHVDFTRVHFRSRPLREAHAGPLMLLLGALAFLLEMVAFRYGSEKTFAHPHEG
ncbi:Variant Ionotropic Glutamate Receptor [Penaeus vannamei]|uniref:Variant Ionotropic Glutamate Receptor n=1 Tax=Penaeus vannamei TaxID=6689 RepID=A0A3R7Q6X9_PENVA|nr:Variant Ionotropic Glutamate Receptor [Penaeus vannamei]